MPAVSAERSFDVQVPFGLWRHVRFRQHQMSPGLIQIRFRFVDGDCASGPIELQQHLAFFDWRAEVDRFGGVCGIGTEIFNMAATAGAETSARIAGSTVPMAPTLAEESAAQTSPAPPSQVVANSRAIVLLTFASPDC